jgi:hypothetical protein
MPILCECPYDASEDSGEPQDKPTTEMLFLICFTRYPAELRRELVSGSPLAPFREALTAAGLNFETSSGAKIFCAVNQYESVLAAMETMDVRPYHVVVSQTCRDLVGRTVEKLPKALKVRIKDENVCEMVPVGIQLAKGLPVSEAKKGKWAGTTSTKSTDSTSEGGSSADASLPIWMPDETAMQFGAPVFPLPADDMVMPFSFSNDLLWQQSTLFHEWVQALQNEHGPLNLQQPVFNEQLAWQMADLLEKQQNGVAPFGPACGSAGAA